jgi:hypothetical protein
MLSVTGSGQKRTVMPDQCLQLHPVPKASAESTDPLPSDRLPGRSSGRRCARAASINSRPQRIRKRRRAGEPARCGCGVRGQRRPCQPNQRRVDRPIELATPSTASQTGDQNTPRQHTASAEIPIASDAQLRRISRGFLTWRFCVRRPRRAWRPCHGPASENLHKCGRS